jgi:hypothetical protein
VALLVLNTKLQSQQFGKSSLLNRRIEPLVCEMQQTALISANSELVVLEIGTPVVDCQQ